MQDLVEQGDFLEELCDFPSSFGKDFSSLIRELDCDVAMTVRFRFTIKIVFRSSLT